MTVGPVPVAPLALEDLAVSLAFLTVIIVALTAVALAAWVYQDARARDSSAPLGWAIATVSIPLLLAVYVYVRGERTAPQSDRERATLAALLALLVALIAGSVFSPPDVFAQGTTTLGALVLTAPLFYLIVYRTEPAGEDEG